MLIGFTGHRKIDHPDRWAWVQEQFARILREVANPGDRVASSLATGGDQLFSQVALSEGIPIEVAVPCHGYETTFDGPGELARYESLLVRAAKVTWFNFVGPSEDAFWAAGTNIVYRSGLVVALWNGKAAAGKGGTGDIVACARKLGLPVIHVHPDLMQVFGLSSSPSTIHSPPSTLDQTDLEL